MPARADDRAAITTLVVPLDGSSFAELALRPAVAFAARIDGARVVLLTCDPTGDEATRRYLDERARRFGAIVDVDVVVTAGRSAADAILDTVAACPGSLLCMATHGHGGVRTALLGSVAEAVVCRTTAPILLVGPACRTALLPGERGDLVITSDGSPFSEIVLPHARAWATVMQLTPWLVEVVPPDEVVHAPHVRPRNREAAAGTARLRRLAARLGHDLSPQVQVLHGAEPARSIATFAERLPAAMVAMASHGRTGLARSLMGSVTADVLRRSPCPVLLVRPSPCERGDER